MFNAFGAAVTLIDVMPTILPLEDADSSKEVERSFKKRGITVLTGAKISNVKAGKDSVSMTVDAGGEKKDLTADVVLVAAGRAPNVEDARAQGSRRAAHRARVHQDQRADGDDGQGHLRHRRRRRPADARAQGRARRRRSRRAARGQKHARDGLQQHPQRDVLPSRGRVGRPHRAAVQGQEARLQGWKVPVLGERPRAHVGRDGRLRQDHPRHEVRRDSRRAHRGRARHGADSRDRRGADERVHGGRSRPRDSRPPDAVRSRRRGVLWTRSAR